MSSSSIDNKGIRLHDVLKQLKNVVARAEFLMTKEKLSRRDKIIIKLSNLVAGKDSHYFGAEAKLYISSLHISKADVLRIMERRGETLSRSGLQGRLENSAKRFVADFGIDAITVLATEQITPEIMIRFDAIELTLLNITLGIDYKDNNLDRLLQANGLDVGSIKGFSSIEDVTQEQVDKLVELLEPYTKTGKAKRVAELNELAHVLWHFRKACLDGSDEQVVNYILRSIL